MTKGIVATWDEAPVQLLPRSSIARAIADNDVRITHRVQCIVGEEEMIFSQQDVGFRVLNALLDERMK